MLFISYFGGCRYFASDWQHSELMETMKLVFAGLVCIVMQCKTLNFLVCCVLTRWSDKLVT